jgi:proline iminopeptidase
MHDHQNTPLRQTFYPPIDCYRHGMLPLDSLHTMYYEESGNPDGIPVVFLHGGPGAGASASHRQFFDPAAYRIIIFDQRGAGRSTPLGELRDNTTPHLIADMETLRNHLNIERWMVFGGSWGSTLALAYAEHHPNRAMALILRGIFLCRDGEIDWFLYGLKQIFPEAWEKFVAPIAPSARDDLLAAYYKLLSDADPRVHLPAARVWSTYEGSCSTLLPNANIVANFASDRVALGLARIEAHYFKHQIFLAPDFLLNNIGKIRHIPTTIVQGRYDAVCPIISAHDLVKAFPEVDYHIVSDAGHSAFEPGISAKLVETMEKLKLRFS